MLETRKDTKRSLLAHADPLVLSQDGFFRFPGTIEPQPAQEPQSEGEFSNISDVTEDSATPSDTWMELDSTPVQSTGYRTWEGFENGKQTTVLPSVLSEAGAATYDALLSWSVDPLKLKNVDVPAVEAKAYFAALFNLTLGRESLLFLRDGENASFKPALPKMRISGLSRDVLKGVEAQCLSCGGMVLELRNFTQAAYASQAGQCRIALASATTEILEAVQNHIAVETPAPRSILQLQATVRRVTGILKPIARLHAQIHKGMGDNDIISLVYRHASLADVDETFVRDMMRELLSRVSSPWIDFFQEWIGTKHEVGPPLLPTSLGLSKWFVTVNAQAYVDGFGREVEDVGFRLDRKGMPVFVPDDLAQSIFETGRNIRFIRNFHPQHALAQPTLLSWGNLRRAKWLFDWDSIENLEQNVAEYHSRLVAAVNNKGTARDSLLSRGNIALDSHEPPSLEFFGLNEQEMESQIEASIRRLNQPLRVTRSADPIANIVYDHLHARGSNSSHDTFAPHWSLLPSLSFGTIAAVQARVVNRETLKILFKEHDLRGHLSLHRDFHLLGNGIFCNRLSHALFDPDLESAERQAGVARQGGVMGLRLGGRDTWPPASSELRLALMGVLTESYSQGKPDFKDAVEDSLPGDLSFAVRDLSEEEIDKCMNPDSLEALDFLRLSYTTPPELLPIITPLILMQYDRIFKLLLRVLRMLYVVNQLFIGSNWTMRLYGYELQDEEYRFVREAQNFVSSIAAYFLGTGVTKPWDAFTEKLAEIENSLYKSHTTNEVPSPDQICETHNQVLNHIMSALFLRKRQQPVMGLVEDIFSCILTYAKLSKTEDAGTLEHKQAILELYHEFKKKVQQFITVCRGLTEKTKVETKEGDGLLSSGGVV